MRMYFTDGIGTPARTSCRLTPMPQSITIGVPLTITRLAGLEAPTPTRGPPLVPRKTTRVPSLAACPNAEGVVSAPAAPAASFRRLRRSIMSSSLEACFAVTLTASEQAVEGRQAGDHGDRDQ